MVPTRMSASGRFEPVADLPCCGDAALEDLREAAVSPVAAVKLRLLTCRAARLILFMMPPLTNPALS